MDISDDRRAKYGLGALRLAAILVAAAAFLSMAGDLTAIADGWFLNAYLGSIGAAVNVNIAPRRSNLVMLGVGALLLLQQLAKGDYATLVILLKTLGADSIAGKIDTLEWKLSLAFVVFLPGFCWWWADGIAGLWLVGSSFTMGASSSVYSTYRVSDLLGPYARIFPALFVVQLISEYGDKHWEQLKVFRHRYAFEILTIAALCVLAAMAPASNRPSSLLSAGHAVAAGLSVVELRVVWLDMLQCFFYRLANWLIILGATRVVATASKDTTSAGACVSIAGGAGASLRQGPTLQYALCWLVARLQGKRIIRVRDVAVARAVFKSSSVKGYCLERCIATPAWAPVLSLESVDGPLWRSMREDFNSLMKLLPPVTKMHEASHQLAVQLAASGKVVDAHEIVQLTLSAFLRYLFDVEWSPAYAVFVDASWEWRKEIAARGRADASVKQAAIDLLVQELLPSSNYWQLFGDRWALPQYYSLILQPFMISPAINVSDIAVAMQQLPRGESLDAVIRQMHPIPILERFVNQDVLLDGRLVAAAGTQVMIFPADLQASSAAWNPFGEGPRQCPGAHLARPLLLSVQQQLLGQPQFQPALHHRYSGRHNDDNNSLQETLYLVGIIVRLIARLAVQRLQSCCGISIQQ